MQPTKLSRAEQARANGAKSTGAKTKLGLERCRLASVKHGGYVSASAIIPGEDPKQYEAMWHSSIDQYQPRNTTELAIVCSIVDAVWRQRRLSHAANHEIKRKMQAIANDSTLELSNDSDIHLRAETESAIVDRLEARARHQTREIARLEAILEKMQKRTVSDEASQMSNEILDLAVEEIENKTAAEPNPAPKEPTKPGKQQPKPENLPRKARKHLRR